MLQIVGMPALGKCLHSLPLFALLWGLTAAKQVLVGEQVAGSQHGRNTCRDGDTAMVPTAHGSALCSLPCSTAPGSTAPRSLCP